MIRHKDQPRSCEPALLCGRLAMSCLLSLALLPTVADAAPTYDSFADVTSNFGSDSDSGGALAEASFSGGNSIAQMYPSAMVLDVKNPSALTAGSASGMITYSDLFFTRLPGYEGAPSTFSTTLQAGISTDAIPGNMSAQITISSFSGSGGGGSASTFDPNQSLLQVSLTSLAVDEPYEVQIDGSVRTTTGSPTNAFLTLALDGATVFDLPEGYTANSSDGMIVDNEYVGPVPEPASIVLFASGALSLVRRRKIDGQA